MLRPAGIILGLCGVCLTSVWAADVPVVSRASDDLADSKAIEVDSVAIGKAVSIEQFRQEHPSNGFTHVGDRIERIYGPAFAKGRSVQETTEEFRLNRAAMWGIGPEDLAAVGPFPDGRHTQQIMYDRATGSYKFTGVYYTQVRDGVPVFRSRLTLLVRNQADYPLVLAAADLRDIGNFHVAANAAAVNAAAGLQAVRRAAGADSEITAGPMVIWAGVDAQVVAPVLALQYTTEGGDEALGTYQKWLFLTDAATGAILHQESQIHHADVAGNVSAMATQGLGADTCGEEALAPMPYAEITDDTTTVFANSDGDFLFPNPSEAAISLTSLVRGQYFVVDSISQPDSQLGPNLTPPASANFIHNEANASEFTRAEVNAYIHANVVRDFLLSYHPTYPVIASQTGFDVKVNWATTCNASYTISAINFRVSGNGCSNTAFSTIVYHEFGHHVIEMAGSGQGAYGEGMADCISVLVTDESCLADGLNTCGDCLRNADNACQFQESGCSSCGSAIHACGTVLSGCIWSTRNALLASNPQTYRDILTNLTINSVLLHGPTSSINPSITVDFLTLDDDNEDITDGTPHYPEISAGFGAHSMPAPPLAALKFNYPNGRPEFIAPDGNTAMRVTVTPITGVPQPGSASFFVSTGGPFAPATITQISPNVYDAIFPPAPCGTIVNYYLTAQTTDDQTVFGPGGAPSTSFDAVSATDGGVLEINDTFETDLGWAVENAGLGGGGAAGGWERSAPNAACDRGNPHADADSSGKCYLTQNLAPPPADPCNSDVDGGTTTLMSPILDASTGAPMLCYWRWYDNIHPDNGAQDDPFVIEFSIDGGTSWQSLETIGPTGADTNGGWVFKRFPLLLVPGFSLTNQFRVRFVAQDLGTGSIVEAAIDGVKLQLLDCDFDCVDDIDGSGEVDVLDLLAIISGWGACPAPCPPTCLADVNADCTVNVLDLLGITDSWGPCP